MSEARSERVGRLSTSPSARAGDAHHEQKEYRSDCGVDREPDDARAKTNSEAVQKPIANERADDADCRVADETEPASSDDLARQPSGNDPDDQNYNQPLV